VGDLEHGWTLWDLATGWKRIPSAGAPSSPAAGIAFVPNGKRLAVGEDVGTVLIRDLVKEADSFRRTAFDGPATALALNAEGTILAVGSAEGQIVLFR
jgi:WD40 repeat protein